MKKLAIAHSSNSGLDIHFVQVPDNLDYICGTYGNLKEDEDKEAAMYINNILVILQIKYDDSIDNLCITEVPSTKEIEVYIPQF